MAACQYLELRREVIACSGNECYRQGTETEEMNIYAHKGVRHQAVFFTCSSSSVVAFAVHDCQALRLENGIAHR